MKAKALEGDEGRGNSAILCSSVHVFVAAENTITVDETARCLAAMRSTQGQAE